MTRLNLLLILFFLLFFSFGAHTQELILKKGTVMDSLTIQDSIPNTFSLFLPQEFELKGKWPLLVVFDMKGRGRKELSKFVQAANRYNYILAASNVIHDSLSLTENMVRTKKLVNHLIDLLPINKSRVFTGGIEDGGRFANLVPIFLKDIEGSVCVNAPIANIELLNTKNPFQYIGVVEKSNFNYPILLQDEKVLNGLKFPNSILLSDTSVKEFNQTMGRALAYLELSAMARGTVKKDSLFIDELYQEDLQHIGQLIGQKSYLKANRAMAETLNIFRTLKNMDSIRNLKKNLKRNKDFRAQKREEEAAIFKETLLREDFAYYMGEDIRTYNFNNLGWWNYQKSQIEKYKEDSSIAVSQMGNRLDGYVNALIEDNQDIVKSQETIDEEALVFLYMLKTITAPSNFDNYLKVASIASKNEDYGTALFYLEEALKKGFNSKDALYTIPHTALLRITPEFNALVKKYFDSARYKVIDQ